MELNSKIKNKKKEKSWKRVNKIYIFTKKIGKGGNPDKERRQITTIKNDLKEYEDDSFKNINKKNKTNVYKIKKVKRTKSPEIDDITNQPLLPTEEERIRVRRSLEFKIKAEETITLNKVLRIKRSITTKRLKNIIIIRIGSFWKVKDINKGKLGNITKEDKYQEKKGNIPIFNNKANVNT